MAQSAADIPLLITSPNSSSERRINPSWTIAHFKTRLEPITGIPASSQKLVLKLGGSQQQPLPIEAADEYTTSLVGWPLQAYAEIHVTSTLSTPLPNYTDTSKVEKYTMPLETYTSLPSTVASFKRDHHLGRFDPAAPAIATAKAASINAVVSERDISVGKRCSVDGRRGEVVFIGDVVELPGVEGAVWIGVRFDEPVGRNDGSVPVKGEDGQTRRYFDAKRNCGGFVRPEKVEVGEFPIVDEFAEVDSDMEEI